MSAERVLKVDVPPGGSVSSVTIPGITGTIDPGQGTNSIQLGFAKDGTIDTAVTLPAGFQRLRARWDAHNERRFDEAMRLLARLLARAARESEEVGVAPHAVSHDVDQRKELLQSGVLGPVFQ